jgi:hypothetical protein
MANAGLDRHRRRPAWRSRAALLATIAIAGEGKAQARIEVGILTCWARGSTGHLVTSTKYLRCRFQRQGRDEFYRGSIAKFGIDVGSTAKTAITWAVLAPTAKCAAALAQRLTMAVSVPKQRRAMG